jgi:serine/threonine protein kinase
LDVLEALEAAHANSIIHCDVRPSNIVVSGTGKGVLIDWGTSRSVSKECGGCGVAAYADERVYMQGTYTARPAQDLSALLYTWLSVAHTHSCSTPWLAGALSDASMFDNRKDWVNALSKDNAGVKRVADLLSELGEDRGKTGGKALELLTKVRELLTSIWKEGH